MKNKKSIILDGINSQQFEGNLVKYLGRWTSICIAMDFVSDTTLYYAEGKAFSGKVGALRHISELFSNNTKLPMVVRIGHYYFDNKPMIGRMVDINMWSR